MISGIILAGGLSKRMGKDKGLLYYEDQSAVERLYEKMRQVCQQTVLVTNRSDDYQEIADRHGMVLINDEIPQKGPLSGVHAGLGVTNSEYSIVIACDMPFADPALFLVVAQDALESGYQMIVAQTSDGRMQPLHAIYHKSCRETIEMFLLSDQRKIGSLSEAVNTYVIPWNKEEKIFKNINTPLEYQLWYNTNEKGI